MSQRVLTGGTQLRKWKGLIRQAAGNSFAAWLAARWPSWQRNRRRSPQRDFLRANRSLPWFALPVHVAQLSWQFAVVARGVLNWTRLGPQRHTRRSSTILRTNEYQNASTKRWIHGPRLFEFRVVPADKRSAVSNSFFFWSSFPLAVKSERAFHHSLFFRQFLGAHSSFRNAGQLGGAPTEIRYGPSHVKLAVRFQSWTGLALLQDFFRNVTLRSQLQISRETSATTTTLPLFIINPTRVSQASTRLGQSIGELRRQTQERPQIFTLPIFAGRAEHPQNSRMELHIRHTNNNSWSRPNMQFAEPSPSSQVEMLSSIRNVESAISKIQRLPAPASPPDVQSLTAQVCDQLERQLRIERERRGR